MSSQKPGPITSDIEVTHISQHGIWLLAGEEEYFLPYDEFPWFKEAVVSQILHVTQPAQGHFYWPNLDIDLSREIILHPDRFPLKGKQS